MVSPVKENKAGYRGSEGGVFLNIEGSRNLEEIKEQVGQYLSNRSPGGGRVKAKALRKCCAQPVQGTADPALGEAREGSRVDRTERQAEVGGTKAVRSHPGQVGNHWRVLGSEWCGLIYSSRALSCASV